MADGHVVFNQSVIGGLIQSRHPDAKLIGNLARSGGFHRNGISGAGYCLGWLQGVLTHPLT